ncbi:caspase family protein [Verrucomicrobium sp. BvORR034]|uniref:caspase family protein n=1 Tax=Verrucomicrobium sp. BvORR034 TaxID=1396418 RepID=UPI000678E16C|nr:caspase family protein [Verrucomicrobium sp. BvORR034]
MGKKSAPVVVEVSAALPALETAAVDGGIEVEARLGLDVQPESRGGERRHWTAAERATLARHVINLRNGQFIESGDYTTTEEDVKRIFSVHLTAALADAKAAGRPLRLLFWAHGGLNDEAGALQHVLTYHQGWLKAGIYPIYFVWETDHGTALRDIFLKDPQARVLGDRSLVSEITDATLEFTLQAVGRPLWNKMKAYAENSVKTKGGALFAARELVVFLKSAKAAVEVYAAGHSAGAIFHSWFVPAALKEGVPGFKELFLLAPAVNVEDFKSRLIKRIGPGSGVDHCTLFTMTEKAEREDTVITIYRKSLLYFVSRACEEKNNTPILGLQEDIYRDVDLRNLFGVGNESRIGQVFWSPDGRNTNSTTHGGFDNDVATLHSMVRLMTGSKETPFAGVVPRLMEEARGSRRVAICVGIDKYKSKPLSGCVNDARQWQDALKVLGFEARLLTDEKATYAGIVTALRGLIRGSRPGDQLVFQYAGHGTHVDDVNGDERDEINPHDNQDEALVPFDYESGSFLIDDDIGDILDTVPAGVSITCFMDCCHSGGNTRFMGFGGGSSAREGEITRYLQVPADIMVKHVRAREANPTKPVRHTYQGKPEVLFAACSPKQQAKEYNGHGYFTITAVPLLLQSAGQLTHEQFIGAVLQDFPDSVEDQDPELNCSDDRLGHLLLGSAGDRVVEGGDLDAEVTVVPLAEALSSPAPAPGTLDIEKLNDTMNTFVKLLDRYSSSDGGLRTGSRGSDPVMDKVLVAINATTGNAIITPETTLSSIGISAGKYNALIKHLKEQFPKLDLGGKQLKKLLAAEGGDTVKNLRNVIVKLKV